MNSPVVFPSIPRHFKVLTQKGLLHDTLHAFLVTNYLPSFMKGYKNKRWAALAEFLHIHKGITIDRDKLRSLLESYEVPVSLSLILFVLGFIFYFSRSGLKRMSGKGRSSLQWTYARPFHVPPPQPLSMLMTMMFHTMHSSVKQVIYCSNCAFNLYHSQLRGSTGTPYNPLYVEQDNGARGPPVVHSHLFCAFYFGSFVHDNVDGFHVDAAYLSTVWDTQSLIAPDVTDLTMVKVLNPPFTLLSCVCSHLHHALPIHIMLCVCSPHALRICRASHGLDINCLFLPTLWAGIQQQDHP